MKALLAAIAVVLIVTVPTSAESDAERQARIKAAQAALLDKPERSKKDIEAENAKLKREVSRLKAENAMLKRKLAKYEPEANGADSEKPVKTVADILGSIDPELWENTRNPHAAKAIRDAFNKSANTDLSAIGSVVGINTERIVIAVSDRAWVYADIEAIDSTKLATIKLHSKVSAELSDISAPRWDRSRLRIDAKLKSLKQ